MQQEHMFIAAWSVVMAPWSLPFEETRGRALVSQGGPGSHETLTSRRLREGIIIALVWHYTILGRNRVMSKQRDCWNQPMHVAEPWLIKTAQGPSELSLLVVSVKE